MWSLAYRVRPADWPWLLVVPVLLTGVVALGDRTGWMAREAMAFLGVEQRRRSERGPLPTTRASANAWLQDHANDGATELERANVLATAGRAADALELIDAFVAGTDEDRVRQLRLRSSIASLADPTLGVDLEAIRAAAATLPINAARYQIVAAAWSQVWLDVAASRSWRARFAAAVAPYAPYPIPRRLWIFGVAAQQCMLPIFLLIVIVLFVVTSRLGIV